MNPIPRVRITIPTAALVYKIQLYVWYLTKLDESFLTTLRRLKEAFKIIYSEDLDPNLLNVRDIAQEVMNEVPKHFVK